MWWAPIFEPQDGKNKVHPDGCCRGVRSKRPTFQTANSTARGLRVVNQNPHPQRQSRHAYIQTTSKLDLDSIMHGANRIGSRRLRPLAGVPGLYNPPGQLSQLSPNRPAARQARLRHRLAQNLSEAQWALHGPFFRLRQSAASYASHLAARPASSERV